MPYRLQAKKREPTSFPAPGGCLFDVNPRSTLTRTLDDANEAASHLVTPFLRQTNEEESGAWDRVCVSERLRSA